MLDYIVMIGWQLAQVGNVAGDEWLEPCAVFEHENLIEYDFSLNVKMAALAEWRQVPPGAISGAHIQVVDGERVTA